MIENKTNLYLFPIIREYGVDFLLHLKEIERKSVFINDIDYLKAMNINYFEPLMFIVVSRKNKKLFKNLLNESRNNKYYVVDYVYEFGHEDHIIVMKLPDDYKTSFLNFLQSSYSKMYSNVQVNVLFGNKTLRTGVLLKAKEYRVKFQEKLKETYDVNVVIEDDRELELPINLKDEVIRWSDVYQFIYLNTVKS